MSEHPAWTWRHAHDELRTDLAAIRKNGQFFSGIPIYERERRWAAALAACGMGGSRNPGAIPLEKLQSRIDIWEQVVAGIGQPIPDDPQIAVLRGIVQDLRGQGIDAFEGPWPMPDDIHSGIGWVWSLWSDEATLDRLQRVTESTLELYVTAIDRELPLLASDLSTRRQLEGQFVGYRQSNRDADPTLMGVPIAWTFVPGASSVSWEIVPNPYGAVAQRAGRASGLRIHNGEPHGLYTHRPATLFAMSLIEKDLQLWGWGKPGSLPDA